MKVGDKVRFIGCTKGTIDDVSPLIPVGEVGSVRRLTASETYPLHVDFESGVDCPMRASELEVIEDEHDSPR